MYIYICTDINRYILANISVLHGVLMATAASVAGCARLHTENRQESRGSCTNGNKKEIE